MISMSISGTLTYYEVGMYLVLAAGFFFLKGLITRLTEIVGKKTK